MHRRRETIIDILVRTVRRARALGVVVLILLGGCATAPRETPAPIHAPAPTMPAPPPPASTLRDEIVLSAGELVGARAIRSHTRPIGYDCAGVVRAVFLDHGIDLYADSDTIPTSNGVRRIHEHMRRHGTLHDGPRARPGDLVFFDNTWDFNGDGKVNDRLTHVGLVERIEPDGTVLFISRVASAIERYRMNLAQPHLHRGADGRLLNDYLRRQRARDRGDVDYLAGELFAGFGTRVE